jgi:hypothetical protein
VKEARVPDESSPTEVTIYVVEFWREQLGTVTVEVAGPPSDEATAEAESVARERMDAREAVAWATVGEPLVVGAGPMVSGAVA